MPFACSCLEGTPQWHAQHAQHAQTDQTDQTDSENTLLILIP